MSKNSMKVVLESPLSGNVKRNTEYLILCMRDCFEKKEYPFASHMLYTQCLNDDIKKERDLGIKAGLEWGKGAEKTVVYIDFGISKGMEFGIKDAVKNNRRIEYRRLNT